MVSVGPTRPSNGEMGFSWGYAGPITLRPGEPYPTRMPHHATVGTVRAGSAAADAGLVEGDTILSVNGTDGREGRLFPSDQPGTEYVMRLRRNGAERETTVTVRPLQGKQ